MDYVRSQLRDITGEYLVVACDMPILDRAPGYQWWVQHIDVLTQKAED